MKKLMVGVIALAAVTATACEEGTGTGLNSTRVAIEFATPVSMSASMLGFGGSVARSVDVDGSNGVLTLDTIHVIVNEFEMERVEGMACDSTAMGGDDDDGDDDGCEEFEAPPTLMQLPLDGGATTAVTADVPEGEYDELEFEVEDLEDDEDDVGEAVRIDSLRSAIIDEFGEWPHEASMRVVGSFTPTEGEAIPFVVYVEAEIEVELEFDAPFVVTPEDVSRTVTVELSPRDWFTRGDGSVIDLSQYDYATTGQVPEFEVEIEDGFKSVEHDDD